MTSLLKSNSVNIKLENKKHRCVMQRCFFVGGLWGRLSAEEFADVFEAFHDIGGGGEFRCDGVLGTEYFFGEFFDESVFVAVFIDDDELFDVGVGLGVGHLYGEVEEVDAFIDFVV